METLRSKIERVLHPTVRLLSDLHKLPLDWMAVLRSALACCPLLTMNLCDNARFQDSVRALGFSQVVQFGNLGNSPECDIARHFDSAAS